MASIDDINSITAAFLEAAADALALTEAGCPERAYTSAGRPAMDCRTQLTCWAQFLGNGDSNANPGGLAGATAPQRMGAKPVLTIFIQVTRCSPTQTRSGLPSPADLAAMSRITNQDVWALWNHMKYEIERGDLSRICDGAWRDGATSIDEQGGSVGWEFVFRYPLEGGYPFEMAT